MPADLVAWQLAGEDEPDPAELDPGLFVCVNVDDDPQNLQTLTLDVLSDDELADQVQIAWTNDVKIDVFSDAQGTAPVASEEERTFDLADLPLQLYVEGVQHSDAPRDVEFTLDYLHDGTVLHTDLIRSTVIEVDLDIANGGSDLDLGGSAGTQPMTVLPEDEEVNPRAYLLVNWDNDDGASPPQPDLDKTSVTNEDNLARLVISLSPAPDAGMLSLSIVASGEVKLWESRTKGTQPEYLSWDLAQEDFPEEFWVEGVYATEEREIAVELTYSVSGSGLTVGSDSARLTVVMINLGNAVYREADIPGSAARGHAALVVEYSGQCTPADLNDSGKFVLIEMDGPTDNRTLDTITGAPELVPFGCYTNPAISFQQRWEVIITARALVARAASIGYCWQDALLPCPWADTVGPVTDLRCDGLVEMCYEINDLLVWGAIDGGPPGYDIRDDTFQQQHNNFDAVWWKDTLMPATQCGYEDDCRGSDWQTTFEPQNLCVPIGCTGGN